ncbi:MAG: hypothetical protein WBN64_12050, partial [Candidatus Deferrimicrobium sp.]
MRSALAVAGFLLLFMPIPSFGGTEGGVSPVASVGAGVPSADVKAGKSPGPATASSAAPRATVAPGMPAADPVAPAPGVSPAPVPSVSSQIPPPPAAPA